MNKRKGKEEELFRIIGFANNTLPNLPDIWIIKRFNLFYYRCRHKRVQYSELITVIYISQTLMHTELTCIRAESRARKCQPRGKRNR